MHGNKLDQLLFLTPVKRQEERKSNKKPQRNREVPWEQGEVLVSSGHTCQEFASSPALPGHVLGESAWGGFSRDSRANWG